MRPLRALSSRALLPAAVFTATALMASPASAQFFASCTTGSARDLRRSIAAHNEHVFRLESKFTDVWYRQGFVGAEVADRITLDGVRAFLSKLPGRKAGVLFHAVHADRLCTWLMTQQGEIIGSRQRVDAKGWATLQRWPTLARSAVRDARVATVVASEGEARRTPEQSIQEGRRILAQVGALLLPQRIAAKLLRDGIDTLIVVPITIRAFNPTTDLAARYPEAASETAVRDRSDAARLMLSVATTPFAALPLGNKLLIDYMSVIVAPGFFTFAQDPTAATPGLSAPILAGGPERTGFAPLPGATLELQEVARQLRVSPLVGEEATRAAVSARLRQRADSVEYIHLATHGLSDAANPLDSSFLVFSDANWTAREIGMLRRPLPGKRDAAGRQVDAPLLTRGPVVVMSACQTGLGKDFDVGTTGLARAWLRAGASTVVMSLWNVDDHATRALMTGFVEHLAAGAPPDQALRAATNGLRSNYPDPLHWAAFGVFGAPLAPRAATRGSPDN